ncbi:hypothetical protein OSTOST_21795, partial [Ostertagia ostertagi]
MKHLTQAPFVADLTLHLNAILVGIYAVTVVVKVALLIKHFCHLHVPAKYITMVTT